MLRSHRSLRAHRLCPGLLALALGAFVGLGPGPAVRAQDAPPKADGAPKLEQVGPRETPRAAMLGYLTAERDGDHAAAATYLDLGGAEDPVEGERLARNLKFVLDQQLWIDPESISNDPAGDPNDGLRRQDQVGVIDSGSGPVPIRLARGADGEWRIAASTVAAIDSLYDEFGLGPLGEYLPEPLFLRVGELALWQAVALLAWTVIAYVLAVVIAKLGLRVGRRLAGNTESELDNLLLERAAGPLTAVILVGLFSIGTVPLGLSVPVRAFLHRLSAVLIIGALAWLTMRAIDVVAATLEQKIRDRADTTVLTVIPVGRRVAKVFLLVIAVLAVLQNMGFNVLSVIAGLGVVGIGVALAAQTTFENFFGTVSILVDQPVRRGDFCRFGDQIGTVEDIGLRSTRIRTLDRTLITVPNSEFSAMKLENFGARDQIRFYTVLGLRYETRADQLRHALIGLKRLLVAHPRVTNDPRRVRFIGYGAHSLDVEVYAYIDTRDWGEFLAIREDLLLQIMDVIEASGTGFAFPSQTLYLGPDTGLNAERARSAAEEVQQLRQGGRLPLPEPAADEVTKLERTLSYPPAGSALGADGGAGGSAR